MPGPAPTTDPLVVLATLPGVEDAVTAAREAVDRLRAHPTMRRHGPQAAAEAGLRAARASAELAGASVGLDDLRAGRLPEGRTGEIAGAALRVAAQVSESVTLWSRAPLQVLAALHLAAAAGSGPADSLGRPRGHGVQPADELAGLPPAPSVGEVSARLDALAGLLARHNPQVPALVLAAVVHGELMALRPFAVGNGLVARAAARLVLIDQGMDPGGVGVPEAGHVALGLSSYAGAVTGFASGTPDGVAAWIRHCAAAVEAGAEEGQAAAERVRHVPHRRSEGASRG